MGLSAKVATLCCSMDNLPFGHADVLWSEGAIYNMGFARGGKQWNAYLKMGGVLVASELTWTTDSRPSELQKYWDGEYPEIDTASAKIGGWRRTVTLPLATLFCLRIAAWRIIIGPCRPDLRISLSKTGIVKTLDKSIAAPPSAPAGDAKRSVT